MPEKALQAARVGHVLYFDIVGYSRGSLSTQARLLEQLNAAVSGSTVYAAAKSAGSVDALPTGDGMVLLFYGDVRAPAQCAVEVSRAIAGEVPVRMGIHSGLVQRQVDISGRENVVGEGINTAQRVMDFGDAAHILLSEQYALWLGQFDEWSPAVHLLAEGVAKHGLKLRVYSLHGEGYGRPEPPDRLKPGKKDEGSASQAGQTTSARVALLYKPTLDLDEKVLRLLEERLRDAGCEVFVDNQQRISANWARTIEEPIRRADAVIAIVSPPAMQSEMLQFEIETAHDQQLRTGKPAILPVVIGREEELTGAAGAILQPLRRFVWNGPEDDPRLIVELLSAIAEPIRPRTAEVKLEPVGGAVPPDSPFYVSRAVDTEMRGALEAGESILLVKGPRQVGKTSLLGQAVRQARESGCRCATTDFQKFNAVQIADDERFYRVLAATLARQLGFSYDFEAEWDPIFGANLNMESFLRALLDAGEGRLVWCMDEVDKLFTAPFASDFFGLVRSWHNARSTEPDGPWGRLTVVIAYATEAHLFIQDLNQSPFNVGRRLELQDFNVQQTVDLNGRYGGPLTSHAECEALYDLVGGQPFLTRRALDALATGKGNFPWLLENATADEGPFGDHLKRLLVAVSGLPEVADYVTRVFTGAPSATENAFHRLRSAGVIRLDAAGRVTFRCELYRRYLSAHLGSA